MPSPAHPPLTTDPELAGRLALAVELDWLKGIERRTWRLDRSRRENSAEHSWHLAMLALVFAEHAPPGTDLDRAVRLCLVHDVAEIDAGDAFAFDPAARAASPALEATAAERIFGLLPPGATRAGLHALRDEFEAAESPAARYAHALDRLAPLLLNVHTEGGTWREHGVGREAVLARMAPIAHGLPALWPVVEAALARAVDEGWVR
ncbi:MAG TPA: HD domain-containing protein [Gemmatirosa sp.]|nr:HD domain-containing protein [Gemmatirosa sp.]